jgi:hypothetical protein
MKDFAHYEVFVDSKVLSEYTRFTTGKTGFIVGLVVLLESFECLREDICQIASQNLI